MEFLKEYFNFYLIRKKENINTYDFKSEELKGNPENNHLLPFCDLNQPKICCCTTFLQMWYFYNQLQNI